MQLDETRPDCQPGRPFFGGTLSRHIEVDTIPLYLVADSRLADRTSSF